MKVLQAKWDLHREESQADMVVVDIAAMVNSIPPNETYAFNMLDEYSKYVFLPYIINLTVKHKRDTVSVICT